MNKPTNQYVIDFLDDETATPMLIVAAKTEGEAIARFVQWYHNEEIPGYEDIDVESFYTSFSVSLVPSI